MVFGLRKSLPAVTAVEQTDDNLDATGRSGTGSSNTTTSSSSFPLVVVVVIGVSGIIGGGDEGVVISLVLGCNVSGGLGLLLLLLLLLPLLFSVPSLG